MNRFLLNASCEKLLAHAASQVLPALTPVSGRASSYGFEYDFLASIPCDATLLTIITEQMRRLISADLEIKTLLMVPKNAEAFLKAKQPLQAALAKDYPANLVPLCKIGDFYDICPHDVVERVGALKAFVLYELLQIDGSRVRIRGACFEEKQELKAFVKRVDRALKNDPVRIAQELELVSFVDEMPLWHPRGMRVRGRLEELFRPSMEPMECPEALSGALALYECNKSKKRPLPYRFFQNDTIESESSDGLFLAKVMRSILAFVFCSENDLLRELISILQNMKQMASILEMECQFVLMHRKKGPLDLFKSGLSFLGLLQEVHPGDSDAIELSAFDLRGRAWAISSVSLKREPVLHLEHRPCSSFERILGCLLEQRGGYLPLWLAPEAVRFVSCDKEAESWIRELVAEVEALGVSAGADCGKESLNDKMRAAHLQKVPCVVVVGRQELASKKLSVRFLPDQKEPDALDVGPFLEKLKREEKQNS